MTAKKILIVEDEVLISAGIQVTLRNQGYDCLAVSTGEDAINQLNIFSPELILMDIGLAGKLDGLSTAAIIRRGSALPIVFISEQDNSRVFDLAKDTKPNQYITKPFTDSELIRAVELALSQPLQTESATSHFPLGDRVSDGIFIYVDGEYKKVLFNDILYIKADRVNTFLYCTLNRKYKIALSSNNVVAQIAWPALVKTNKSSYVNIHKVESIRNDELKIEKEIITLSKTYRDDFLNRVKKIKQQ